MYMEIWSNHTVNKTNIEFNYYIQKDTCSDNMKYKLQFTLLTASRWQAMHYPLSADKHALHHYSDKLWEKWSSTSV